MSNISQMFAHPGWALRDWIPKKTSLRGRRRLWHTRQAHHAPAALAQLWQLRGKYFANGIVVKPAAPP
jgi:hypothetical protein